MAKQLKKKEATPEPLQTVWVVTAFLHTIVPKIEQYQAVKINRGSKPGHPDPITSVRVKYHGFPQTILAAQERHFFDDEAEMRQWVHSYMNRKRGVLAASLQLLKSHLDDDEPLDVRVYEPEGPANPAGRIKL